MQKPDPRTPSEKDRPAGKGLPEEGPPLFRTWRGWYLLVLGNLVALVLIFYWLTQYFS
ncbi:MAG: hypothetical protein WBB45_11595 [Cyclobacteriaceae bacterium]